MTDPVKLEMSSEEMIRRARRGPEGDAAATGTPPETAEAKAYVPEPVAAEPPHADPLPASAEPERAELHDFESIGRVQLADRPYPSDLGIVLGAVGQCLTLFEPHVGVPFDETGLLVDAFVPTEGSWEDGDRDALCVVFEPDAQFSPVPMAGSARNSG